MLGFRHHPMGEESEIVHICSGPGDFYSRTAISRVYLKVDPHIQLDPRS